MNIQKIESSEALEGAGHFPSMIEPFEHELSENHAPTVRVLHFFKTYLPDSIGGIEQVIYQLCEGGRDFSVHSEVLALSPQPSAKPARIGSHRVHQVRCDIELASTGISWAAITRLRELAAKVDLIHYHFPWPFMDVAHYLAGIHKPYVVTYHSDIIRQKFLSRLYQPLMSHFLGRADKIIATSPNYLATSSVLKKFKQRVSIIPIGLDKACYPSAATEKLDKWRLRLELDRFFLFVGVMRYYKGLHILLDALKGTDFRVVIVGAGPLQQELMQQAKLLGVNRNLVFLGRLDEEDKTALLELCYGVVFPSHLRSEAFGISLLEGAMFGKPLISSEIGTGTSYINLHEETGLVVPPNDPAALRAAMRLLWNNPEKAMLMGARAVARYRELFTAECMARQHSDLYREILRAPNA